MKKIIGGGIFFISGISLYVNVLEPTIKLASTLDSWTTPPGRLGTSIETLGINYLMKFSYLLMALGFILIMWGLFENNLKKLSFKKNKK
ncbi:hypothetical protein PA598K_03192 [Paenibacillus sp. 598K]|uniref:hypothetical protein n=1 Tax=Paenibacillus sp. 598K TaxID=1117987 RepID=UPI000FF8FFB2|nr:hypothetical protein [Paenibacillus sp. 598K]GBF74824.1 hypothetical protein PA598K_03192 [Paenibacillus sp. 598K]